MPNWCACSLSVTGSEDHLKSFYETLNKPDAYGNDAIFSFHQTVPRPSDADWYKWNNKHWDTKWDVKDVNVVTHTATKFLIQFDTAWSPPSKWLETAADQYPELIFRLAYCEVGAQFYGVKTFHVSRCEAHSSEYTFLNDDILTFDDSEDERNGDVNPDGRLFHFMSDYSLSHIGG